MLKKEEIKHVAELARLELSDDELEKYGGQLSAILGYVEQLQEVDATGVEETAQVTDMENVFREDEIEDWDSAERQSSLDQAPSLENGQVKVKRVL